MIAVEAGAQRKVWTEDEIMSLPDNGYDYEIVDGELIMSPKNNPEHGGICVRISSPMHLFARKHKLGEVWDSNTGFWMINRNLRAPDISFVTEARLKSLRPLKSFFEGAPDLAVEVLSSTNTRREMDRRLRDFFESGTQIVWIIDPERQMAEVCYSLTNRKLIGPGGALEGEHLLPGFTLPLDSLFEA
jgi:Uma2 family endonuclease